jgi:hypothetical protein
VDPRDAAIVEPAEAAARYAVSELPAEPEVVRAEPTVTSATQVGVSLAEGAPSWKRRAAWGAVVVVVLGAVGVALMMRPSRPVDSPEPELPAATVSVTPAAEPRSEPSDVEIGHDAAGPQGAHPPSADSQVALAAPALPDPSPVSTAPAVATPQSADSRPLEVSEFDLGTGVTDLRVVDVRREFEEGAVASFLTRVRGGAPGQTITHVWIRDGLLVQSIELRLGAPTGARTARRRCGTRGSGRSRRATKTVKCWRASSSVVCPPDVSLHHSEWGQVLQERTKVQI